MLTGHLALAAALFVAAGLAGAAHAKPPVLVDGEPSEAAWRACVERGIMNDRIDCTRLKPPSASDRMPEGEVRPDFDQAARDYIIASLKDPESARIEQARPPRKGPALGYRPERFFPPAFGWTACYRVNAKNSYGGYTGYKYWVVGWLGDRWEKTVETVPDGWVPKWCRGEME